MGPTNIGTESVELPTFRYSDMSVIDHKEDARKLIHADGANTTRALASEIEYERMWHGQSFFAKGRYSVARSC